MAVQGKRAVAALRSMRHDLEESEKWDFENWEKWEVTGRVLPERCCVSIQEICSKSINNLGCYVVRFECVSSHLICTVFSEKTGLSIYQLSDLVRLTCFPMIDSIGLSVRGYLELILDTCTGPDGKFQTIPVSEPFFEPRRAGFLFDPKQQQASGHLPMKPTSLIPELATAMHDLSQALRYPSRTMEYCRMALEAIRGYFDPQGNSLSWRQRHVAGEKAMCEALRLSRAQLVAIEAFAGPSRHGSREVLMDWATRRDALEFSWEAVHRFTLLRSGADSSEWLEV